MLMMIVAAGTALLGLASVLLLEIYHLNGSRQPKLQLTAQLCQQLGGLGLGLLFGSQLGTP